MSLPAARSSGGNKIPKAFFCSLNSDFLSLSVCKPDISFRLLSEFLFSV